MKVAIVGTGKTGQHLLHLIPKADIVGPFNRSHSPQQNLTELQGADVVILFVPGESALELIPLMQQLHLPCVWGSTGVAWPKDLSTQLEKKQLTWIYASNFALGMVLMRELLNKVKKVHPILPQVDYHLKEVHHTHKKDAPSGTALLWRQWLTAAPSQIANLSIHSERSGDTIGIHELTITTPQEEIKIQHKALDRSLFAQGALVAAQALVSSLQNTNPLPFGLLPFDQMMTQLFTAE